MVTCEKASPLESGCCRDMPGDWPIYCSRDVTLQAWYRWWTSVRSLWVPEVYYFTFHLFACQAPFHTPLAENSPWGGFPNVIKQKLPTIFSNYNNISTLIFFIYRSLKYKDVLELMYKAWFPPKQRGKGMSCKAGMLFLHSAASLARSPHKIV